MIVYLMCGWYRHHDGMADYYEVEATLEKAKQACLNHAIGWLDDEDEVTLEWDESNPENITAEIEDTFDGDYIYEIKRRDLSE